MCSARADKVGHRGGSTAQVLLQPRLAQVWRRLAVRPGPPGRRRRRGLERARRSVPVARQAP
jgi:hypothetical protein